MIKKLTSSLFLLTVFAGSVCSQHLHPHHGVHTVPPPWTRRPLVQLALILDIGPNSNGLIYQARTELYTVANELLLNRKGNEIPIVQFAVIRGSSHSARIVSRFSVNYDAIVSSLDRTSGGASHIQGDHALALAINRLQWSPYPEDLKYIIMAGSGRLNLSRHALTTTCDQAVRKGIQVHTLYTGAYAMGVQHGWAQIALHSGGCYSTISTTGRLKLEPTEFNPELQSLTKELLNTYRLRADSHRSLWAHQEHLQKLVKRLSQETAIQRIITKAIKGRYLEGPLQSGHGQSSFGLERDISHPPDLSSASEMSDYQEKFAQRQVIFARIIELGQQRHNTLAARPSRNPRRTLGWAIIQILRGHVDF